MGGLSEKRQKLDSDLWGAGITISQVLSPKYLHANFHRLCRITVHNEHEQLGLDRTPRLELICAIQRRLSGYSARGNGHQGFLSCPMENMVYMILIILELGYCYMFTEMIVLL
jgi:hypothetical protein